MNSSQPWESLDLPLSLGAGFEASWTPSARSRDTSGPGAAGVLRVTLLLAPHAVVPPLSFLFYRPRGVYASCAWLKSGLQDCPPPPATQLLLVCPEITEEKKVK